MSLIQFLHILLARKNLILLTTLASLLVATVVVISLPKRYPGYARVLMDNSRPDPVTGRGIGGSAVRSYMRTQVEFLRDMRVVGQVVDRLGLANSPEAIAAYEASGRSAADGGIRNWLGQQLIERIGARSVSGSDIVEIVYEGRTPEEARLYAGEIRDAYIDTSLRFRVDTASRFGDWFGEQADDARRELQQAEAALADFMKANNVSMQGGVELETVKLQNLQQAVLAARGAQTTNEAAAAVRLSNDPVVDNLRGQIALLEDQLAQVSARLGPNHPTYKALQSRIGTLQKQISIAQSSTRSGVSALANASRQSLASLEAQLAAQERLVEERRPIIDRLILLSRDVEMKRGQYERAVARQADLELEAASSETGLVVLGDPIASTTPSYPKIPQVIGLSIIAGLMLGIFAALVIEFFARRIRGAEDLAFASGAPVIVTVTGNVPSPFRQRIQRLLGRRDPDVVDGDLQAI